MNKSLKLLAALLALIIPALSTSQELHTFSNGEVADADKINENFQYLLNSGGGCSATQDGSSVVITCADGSSGVLASEGTVVVYPEGSLGTVPITNLPQGEFVIYDANSTLLGRRSGGWKGVYDILLEVTSNGQTFTKYIRLVNDEASSSVEIIDFGQPLYFAELDCHGEIFTGSTSNLLPNLRDGGWLVTTTDFSAALMKSYISWPPSDCENSELILNAPALALEYTPPPEILNAAYPVRIEQLP